MGSVVEQVRESVVKEAVDELGGRSTRKWGVILVVLVLGGLLAAVLFKARQRSAAEDGSSTPP